MARAEPSLWEAAPRHCLSFLRFLDVLAARKDPSGLMGQVLIDGAPQPPNFKCLSGYVVQVSQPGQGGGGAVFPVLKKGWNVRR